MVCVGRRIMREERCLVVVVVVVALRLLLLCLDGEVGSRQLQELALSATSVTTKLMKFGEVNCRVGISD